VLLLQLNNASCVIIYISPTICKLATYIHILGYGSGRTYLGM
jgi:hypothetical protein